MENGLKKPLLHQRNGAAEKDEEEEPYLDEYMNKLPTTDYESVGWFGTATFLWMNSILTKGARKALTADDVPLLMKKHRSNVLYRRFISNWPQQRAPNSVRNALVKTFLSDFLFSTTVPALLRLSVLFVGPSLISSFVNVVSGAESYWGEGYVLVLVLFLAKTTEITCMHLLQFNCQKLGVQLRSALISAVYRKGLRMSSFARQSHGLGQIVNYMSTDVQQISDSVYQLNNLWMIPAQLLVAIILVFYVAGMATWGGVAVIVVSGIITYVTATGMKKMQKRVMTSRDGRLLATVESLNNMKIIKLQAWDGTFFSKVSASRAAEYNSLAKYMYATAMSFFVLWSTPVFCSVAIVGSAMLLGEGMSAAIAFTVIATVKMVQSPLRLFPQCVMAISQAQISLQRLEEYFWSEELDRNAVERLPFGESDLAVNIEGGTFKWIAEVETPALQDINLQIKPGTLVAVVGRVGTGKSSLLAAILGEMTKTSGSVKTCGTTAYVSQQAWIQSGTIQDNILFGQPLDKGRYQSAIQSCALKTDLAEFTFGDQTEIGERGLNLSGGQKQRIQLARAVYQDCDNYILDDIFSAVDAHTASSLFRDCITGVLAGKTVILVTHQIDFLPGADLIIVLKDGRIVQSGHYEELLDSGTEFETLVEATNEALNKVGTHEPAEPQPKPQHQQKRLDSQPSRRLSANFERTPLFEKSSSLHMEDPFLVGTPTSPSYARMAQDEGPHLEWEPSLRNYPTADGRTMLQAEVEEEDEDIDEDESSRLVEHEEREIGTVSWRVYWNYFTSLYKGWLFVAVLLVHVGWQAFQIGGDYWVAYGLNARTESDKNRRIRFVEGYAAFAAGTALAIFLRSFLVAFIGLRTCQTLYNGMLNSIFRAPMSFFDTTPTGRILSRASTDQASLDVQVPILLPAVLSFGFQLAGVLFVTIGVTWQILFLLVPLFFAYLKYQNYYFATSRELTRIDAITKALVIHHFSETISGFTTVRCFQQEDRFIRINVDTIDSNLRMDFHNQGATDWVGFRMEFMGVMLLCVSSLVLVTLRGFIDEDLVGLCLSYGMSLNASFFVVSWMYCNLENKMVSAERIGQYTKLPAEAELSIVETRPPPRWPHSGNIMLNGLKLRYREHTPLVLKGIDLDIKGGNKVGVVGRTGSGKSTLILALFRLVEAAEGSVVIDKVDISTLGLNDLRSRLSIIPQDPAMFDGTIRSNIDPLGSHSDPEIWEALEKCQLAGSVKELPEKLDAVVLENGENWSLGQRQLFCLGRVLLKRSQILVLDEATASVDAETDAVMQTIIRREFDNCTVVSIAHRIPTVMDSDKVLVLDAGKVKEYGSPEKLLDNPKSMFSALISEYTSRAESATDSKGATSSEDS